MIKRSEYTTTKEFFNALTASPTNRLLAHIEENPKILEEQDEDGGTLFHHALSHERDAAFILQPYMTKETLSVRDKQGRTPVHIASLTAGDTLQGYRQVAPLYLGKAASCGYDFTLTDNEGHTPFMKIIFAHSFDPYCERRNMVRYFAHHVPNIDVNHLYKEGFSPLGLLLAMNRLEEATALLDLGADPSLYKLNPELPTNPFDIIDLKIKTTTEKIAKIERKLADNKYDEGQEDRGFSFNFGIFKTKASKKKEYIEALKTDFLPKLEELKTKMAINVFKSLKIDAGSYVRMLPKDLIAEEEKLMSTSYSK